MSSSSLIEFWLLYKGGLIINNQIITYKMCSLKNSANNVSSNDQAAGQPELSAQIDSSNPAKVEEIASYNAQRQQENLVPIYPQLMPDDGASSSTVASSPAKIRAKKSDYDGVFVTDAGDLYAVVTGNNVEKLSSALKKHAVAHGSFVMTSKIDSA